MNSQTRDNLGQCLEDHAHGRTVVSGTPDKLTIESTAICNLRCVMCPQSIDAVNRPRHMSVELEEKLAPFMERAGTIQLHGIGEPTASSAFWRLIQRLPGQSIGDVNSNFTLLNDARLEKLAASSLKTIHVSLDAARPETYRRIRGFDFEKVVNNIRRFIQYRNNSGKSTPRLMINMTLMRENIEEAVEFVELAHRLEVDGVEMWHLNVLDPEEAARYQHDRDGWIFKYADQVLAEYPALSDEWMTRASTRATELGVPLVLPRNGRQIFYEIASPEPGEAVGKKARRSTTRDCRNPWRWLMVTSNGDVRPCCYATSGVTNLESVSLEEAWNGESMQQVRRELLQNRVPSVCRGAACEYVKNTREPFLRIVSGVYERSGRLLKSVSPNLYRKLRALKHALLH